MRCIFFIFFIVFTFLTGPVYADKGSALMQSTHASDQDTSYLKKVLIDFNDTIQGWQQDLKQASSKDIQDFKQNGFLTTLYLLTQSEANLFSGLDGLGKWQDFPFGRMRLISCQSALDKNHPVFIDVQMEIFKDWYLKKPTITLKTPVKESVISYPLFYPLPKGITRTDFYTGESLFPIFLVPESYENPLDIVVEVDWQAHHPFSNASLSDKTTLTLNLKSQKSYETNICTYMYQHLVKAPAPLKDNARISATLNSAGEVQLFFDFKQEISFLSIQIDAPWTFTQTQKSINGHTAILTLKPTTTLKEGDTLPIKIITSYGIFDAPTPLKRGVFKSTPVSLPLKFILTGGFLLFLTSPLLALFLLSPHKTKAQMIKNTTTIVWALFIIGIITTLIWHAGLLPVFSPLQLTSWIGWGYILLFLWLYWHPYRTILGALLLMLIFPKPYLGEVIANATGWEPLIIGLWWTVSCLLPFWWIKQYPNALFTFYKLLKKEPDKIIRMTKLPLLIWTIWLGIGGAYNAYINEKLTQYTPMAIKEVIEQNKIAFVSVENPICLSCALNKGLALKTGPAKYLTQEGKIIQFYLSATSFYAKELMHQKGKNYPPVNLFFSQKIPDGIRVPNYLSYPVLYQYLPMIEP